MSEEQEREEPPQRWSARRKMEIGSFYFALTQANCCSALPSMLRSSLLVDEFIDLLDSNLSWKILKKCPYGIGKRTRR